MIETKVSTRFRIVGVEVVGLGGFLIFLFAVSVLAKSIQAFDWDFAIVGGTMVMIGYEILHLIRFLPSANEVEAPWR